MKITISKISIPPRQRLELNLDHVNVLADSFLDCGMVQAITVSAKQPDDTYLLIAGCHRLHAAMKLGWKTIECTISGATDEITRQKQELVEDTRRLNRSWQDECLTISKLHYLIANERALDGQQWTKRMMVAFTGYPDVKVTYGLEIAKLLKQTDPLDEAVWKCDNFEQALQLVLGRVDQEAVREIERRKQAMVTIPTPAAHPDLISANDDLAEYTGEGEQVIHLSTQMEQPAAPVRIQLKCNLEAEGAFPAVFLIIAYKPDHDDSISEWMHYQVYELRRDAPSYLVVLGIPLPEFDDWKTAAMRCDLRTMPFPIVWNRQCGATTLWPFLYDNTYGLVFQSLPKDYKETQPENPPSSLIQSFPCAPDDRLPAAVVSYLCQTLCPIGEPVLFPCNASPVECAMAGHTPIWYEQDADKAEQQKKELTEWYKNNVPGCEVVQ